MTTPTTDATPVLVDGPPAAPTRSPLARVLTVTGAGLGLLVVGLGGVQLADHLTATTTSATASYGAAPVVELVADGDVDVVGGAPGARVDVARTARAGFTGPSYTVQEGADRLVVEHRCTPGFFGGTCSGSLAVQVPDGTQVVLRTSDGEVRVAGVVGDVEARTGDGGVDISDVDGAVRLDTGDGDVTVAEVTGAVVARSGDGVLRVLGAGGDVEARTGDGDVLLDGARGDVVLRTGDGTMDVRAVDGDVEATSGDGDVTVHGTGAPVALTTVTGDGRVVVDAPTDPTATRTVTIRTGDGDIAYRNPTP